jgi:hypothetical protein
LEERELRLILSTAKKKQTQLECYDFMCRGKKRFVELMWSDNKLEIIHIMKTESDHDELKAILTKKYGKAQLFFRCSGLLCNFRDFSKD